MNDRIRELALQANLQLDNLPDDTFIPLENFAELIVRECEQVSLKNSHRNDDMGSIIAKQIKKHFGVER